jgi:rhodanese-related sulfurtransferase
MPTAARIETLVASSGGLWRETGATRPRRAKDAGGARLRVVDDSGPQSRIDEVLADARRALPHRPTADELPALRARGALIVDIRPIELRARDGELPGALVIDRNVLEWRLDPTSPHRIPEATDPARQIVIVCNEGYASSLAALSLQRLGLRGATDLDGGFQAVLNPIPD